MQNKINTLKGNHTIDLEDVSKDDPISRYIKFEQLKDYLAKGFYLNSIDCCYRHYTPSDEGEYPRVIYDLLDQIYMIKPSGDSINGKTLMRNECDRIRKHSWASYWTLGNTDDWEFWNGFAVGNRGVAIRTSVGCVKNAIEDAIFQPRNKESLTRMLKFCTKKIVKVAYVDYRAQEIAERVLQHDETFLLQLITEDYHDENEVRILITSADHLETRECVSRFSNQIIVVEPNKLDTFINEIIVSPRASDNDYEIIVAELTPYRLETKVKKSALI